MHLNDADVSGAPTVLAIGPGRWTAELSRPDAIVLMGLAVNAVLNDMGERCLQAVTTHFAAPARVGRVEITVGRIDRTAAGTTTDARIQQSGHVIARLLLTTATVPDPEQ